MEALEYLLAPIFCCLNAFRSFLINPLVNYTKPIRILLISTWLHFLRTITSRIGGVFAGFAVMIWLTCGVDVIFNGLGIWTFIVSSIPLVLMIPCVGLLLILPVGHLKDDSDNEDVVFRTRGILFLSGFGILCVVICSMLIMGIGVNRAIQNQRIQESIHPPHFSIWNLLIWGRLFYGSKHVAIQEKIDVISPIGCFLSVCFGSLSILVYVIGKMIGLGSIQKIGLICCCVRQDDDDDQ